MQSRGCPSAHVGAYSKSWSLKTWSQPTLKPKFEAAQFQWLALSRHCEVSHSFESTLWKDRSVDISAELRPNLNSFAAFAVHPSFGQSWSFWRRSSPLCDLDLFFSIFFCQSQQDISSSVHRNRNRLSILPSSADPVEVICKLSRESIQVYEIVPPCSLTLRLCKVHDILHERLCKLAHQLYRRVQQCKSVRRCIAFTHIFAFVNNVHIFCLFVCVLLTVYFWMLLPTYQCSDARDALRLVGHRKCSKV